MSAQTLRQSVRAARRIRRAIRVLADNGVPLDEVLEPTKLAELREDADLVLRELEERADARAALNASVRRHYFGSQKHGVEWLSARIAEDLGL